MKQVSSYGHRKNEKKPININRISNNCNLSISLNYKIPEIIKKIELYEL